MANVVIDDSSLYAIGDALRGKLGETRIEKVYVETIHHPETLKQMEPRIAKTSNALGFDSKNGGYPNNMSDTQTIIIEDAVNLIVDFACQTEGTNYDYLLINGGAVKYGGTTLKRQSVAIEGNRVDFTFRSDGSGNSYLGYYAEVFGVDANGNVLQEVIPAWDEDIYEEVEKENIYKPRDMADAINSIKGQMNYVVLTRRDYYSFDLTPYINEGDNFILYFSQHTSTSTGSSVWNGMYTTFFTEEQRQGYKYKFSTSNYNKNGISKWAEDGSASSTERAKSIATSLTSTEMGTGYDTVTLTYENGILTNSIGVGISAILVYPS